ERHRDWCLQVADGPPPEAFDTTQVERLAPDLDNLRAALQWTLETRQLAAAAELALGLTIVWHLRGSFSEGRAALTAVLNLAPDDCALAEVAHAGSWASVMATTQGDYLAAERLLPRAVKIARASGDAYVLLFAENQLGWVAYTRGDIGTARDLYERTHRIVSATGGPFHPVSQYQLALCCIEQGDCVRAQELVDTFPEVPTASGRAFHTGRLLYVRALLAEQAGDYVGADALFERAILAQQALDDQPGLLRSLTLRGAVMAAQGDRQIAAAALAEAFEASELHASKLTVAHLLEAVANLVLDTDVVACVRLAAAAGHLRTVVGAAPLPTEQHRLGRYLDIARQRIGEPAYAGAWLAAEAESLDDSLVLAGQLLSSVGNAPVRSATNRQGDALSERERQVALLVTRGYNNREIAEELVISLKTAEAHIHHILNKLGLSNRVQIATWGLRHGIASSEVGKALQPDRAWATLS
ncbi:MAG: response regulator transcription factor, partial [Chloroflexi bacterium]|nr:response regulator transcription factor [Chloroflexota bacterium]